MIKVVLDANVFVSAVLKPQSDIAHILELIRENAIQLFVSPDILAEVKRVLSYPRLRAIHRRSPRWIKSFIQDISALAEITPGELEIDAVKDDPSDNIYLPCAVEGQVDFVVSGDKHLKNLRQFQGIPIVEPAEFLNVLFQD